MNNADWKKYKKIRERAYTHYCQQQLDAFQALITDDNETVCDRVYLLKQAADKSRKDVRRLFESHNRHMASLELFILRSEGIVDEDWIEELSEEIQQQSKPLA